MSCNILAYANKKKLYAEDSEKEGEETNMHEKSSGVGIALLVVLPRGNHPLASLDLLKRRDLQEGGGGGGLL